MNEDLDAYTIPEFCSQHRFSRQGYYNLPPEDRPDEIRIGKRVLISREAAARWRRRMERKSKRAKLAPKAA
jgi:hypothetical protein